MKAPGSTPNKPVVVFGTGTLAELAHVYLTADSDDEVVAFTVDAGHARDLAGGEGGTFLGLDVVVFDDLVAAYPPDRFSVFVAVGYRKVNAARAEIYQRCKALGYELITYVSSRAIHTGSLAVGDNCFVMEGALIQPRVRIGNDVILWSGSHVQHHSVIGDHCFVGPDAAIAGEVTIEPSCFVGVNATIRNGVTIGAGSVIGAGAVVLRDVPAGHVWAAGASRPVPVDGRRLRDFA